LAQTSHHRFPGNDPLADRLAQRKDQCNVLGFPEGRHHRDAYRPTVFIVLSNPHANPLSRYLTLHNLPYLSPFIVFLFLFAFQF
jgi:hypothetical protein